MTELFADPMAPFAFPFMRNAFLITTLVAVPMALLSCLLVLKGWSLMGDAISHALLPGIVLAYVLSIPLAIGAFAAGMVCALATGYLKENSRVKEDTVMGVVFSGMFGLGIVMYVAIETDEIHRHREHGPAQQQGEQRSHKTMQTCRQPTGVANPASARAFK